MGNSRFYQQLRKYLSGKLSPAEKARFNHWLDSLGKVDAEGQTPNQTVNQTLNQTLSDEDQQKLFSRINAKIDSHERKTGVRKLSRIQVIKIAASLILLVSVAFFLWSTLSSSQQHLEISAITQTLQGEKRILNDGTLVWLQGSSKLVYQDNAGDGMRHASLTGEGLFEIAKDPDHPFVIDCKGVIVKVLGTSFHLKSNLHGVELKVLTGKVNLSSGVDEEGINVNAREKVVYSVSGRTVRLSMNDTELSSIIANTEYSMKFNNIDLSQVLDRIRQKFAIKIASDNPEVNQCRITGDFTDQSLEKTLTMISEMIDLKYSIFENTVTITGTGCK